MKHIFIFIVKIYRKFISPLKAPCCKFYPTCSAYSLEAFERHGAVKGFILSSWRLIRCNPWSIGGIDPVPEEYHIFGHDKNSEKKISFGRKKDI